MIRLVDAEGVPAPLWLAKLLADADLRDPFWADRRQLYRVEVAR